MPASTFAEQIRLQPGPTPDTFATLHNPFRIGHLTNIAFGGCTISTGISAAHATLPAPTPLRIYTVLGNFLGSTLTDRPLHATVRRIRDTRTFATRFVELSQDQDNGSRRLCLTMLADFHVPEGTEVPGMRFSEQPLHAFVPVDQCPNAAEAYAVLERRGTITKQMVELHKKQMGPMDEFFEQRNVPGGVMSQNLVGWAKGAVTSQDNLPLTSRTSSLWFRNTIPLSTPVEHAAAMAFNLDGAIAFVPILHSHMGLMDVAACSSLDFAIRLFVGDVDLNEWHVKEMKTVAGGEGRTYSEARIWDQTGRMVANLTQQSILRPKKEGKL
jgi:acyl-CoA thioesterase II